MVYSAILPENGQMSQAGYAQYVMKVASAIRQARQGLGLTQEQAAHQAEVSVRWYAQLESGKLNPTLELLFKVSGAFEMMPAMLLALAEELPKKRKNYPV
jgi:transcriptional regulator with XRE-family HTH domain